MRRIRELFHVFLSVALIHATIGCASTPPPLPNTRTEALEQEIAKADKLRRTKKGRRDIIDAQLRVASMALDAGKLEVAREHLSEVVVRQEAAYGDRSVHRQARRVEGTFGGTESKKVFLGDPYEQLYANIYLGILDFQAEEYELARTSFRAATEADRSSKDEGFRSDSYLAFLLEGIASRQLGDQGGAQDAFRWSQRAFSFRQRMPMLSSVLYGTISEFVPENANKAELKQADKLFPLVYSYLPVAVSSSPDPVEALETAFNSARDAVQRQKLPKKSPEKEFVEACHSGGFMSSFGSSRTERVNRAVQIIDQFRAMCMNSISEEVLLEIRSREDHYANLIREVQADSTNTFMLIEQGNSPVKVRLGKYGEVVTFRASDAAERRLALTVEEKNAPGSDMYAALAFPGESTDYQATTRGGRAMDSVLKGRAQFRDAMNATSMVAGSLMPAAATAAVAAAMTTVTTTTVTTTATVSASGAVTTTTTTTTSTAPAGMAAAGPFVIALVALFAIWQGTKWIQDAVHPEGDIRGWHELPQQLYFVAGSLEPGDYELSVREFDNVARPIDKSPRPVLFRVHPNGSTMVLCTQPW